MTVFIDHGTGSNNLIAKQYGARWRELRKITHHGVGQQQIRNYRDFQNNESKQIPWVRRSLCLCKFWLILMQDILQDPEEFVNHFERYAASTVSIIGFGRRLQSYKFVFILCGKPYAYMSTQRPYRCRSDFCHAPCCSNECPS